jgi:hypothetical protein
MKYAIRIVSGDSPHFTRLFAVVKEDYATVAKFHKLAKESIPYGSSDWVVVHNWVNSFEFLHHY